MHFAKAKKAKQAAATLEADKKNNEGKEPTEPGEKKKAAIPSTCLRQSPPRNCGAKTITRCKSV